MATIPEFIPHNQVTTETVYAVLDRAYLKPEMTSGGEITLRGVRGLRYWVEVETDKNVMSLFLVFGTKEAVGITQCLSVINGINCKYLMAKCSLQGTTVLINYEIVIEEGISPLQILSCFRKFDGIATSILSEDEMGQILDW